MKRKTWLAGLVIVLAALGYRASEAVDVGRTPAETVSTATTPLPPAEAPAEPPTPPDAAPAPSNVAAPPAKVDRASYAWLAEIAEPVPELAPLASRFAPPKGYRRAEVADASYAAWLRGLPLRLDRKTVHAFDGRELRSPAAAIVFMDVGDRDLQQCADSAIRLHAEYRWHVGQGDKVSYHFTSGDLSSWKGWRSGERFVIAGNAVKKVNGPGRKADHATFRDYLSHLFRYAGTQSLRLDSDAVPPGKPLAGGDFFVSPGAPGHAIVVLDVAENAAGEQVALMGQGYMPAQEFHVLADRGEHVLDGVWFKLPAGADGALSNPSWQDFPRTAARRFR